VEGGHEAVAGALAGSHAATASTGPACNGPRSAPFPDVVTGKLPWNAPVFVEAIKLLNDWWQKGYFSKNYYALSGTEATNDIATGKAAMTFSGSWAIHDMAQTFGQSGQAGRAGRLEKAHLSVG